MRFVTLLFVRLLYGLTKVFIAGRFAWLYDLLLIFGSLTAWILGFLPFFVWYFITAIFVALLTTFFYDRLSHKMLTPYVVLNRVTKTIHMSSRNLHLKDVEELRRELPKIIHEFVEVGIPKLNPNKTYTFRTHQLILDELQKHRPFIHVATSRGIVLERYFLLPARVIFDRRYRRRFLYMKSQKYKVTI